MSNQPQMLNALFEIVQLDFRSLQRWFVKNTASKIVVSIAYLSVLLLVALGIFFWSNAFFRYLIGFEEFGLYTSEYILKGAFAILIWIGILSSLISTVAFLVTPNRFTDHLLTLPIPDLSISLHQTLRALLTNTFLFLVSIFPLVLGFIFSLTPEGRIVKIAGLFLALVVLVFLTESIGSAFAYLSVFLSKRRFGVFVNALSFIVLISATWILIRIVFPPQLQLLGDISADDFLPFFNNLPLNSSCWLGNSFLVMSTKISSQSIYLLTLGLVSFIVSLLIKKSLLIPCRQGSRVTSKIPVGSKPLFYFSKINLVSKDILSILRSPQNLGYALFLIIMIVTFFGLFSRGYLVGTIPQRFKADALAFSFSWLVFFSGTFLLRFVYPLMVNEGKSRWWFLTIPVDTALLVSSKMLASLLITLPLFVIAFAEWYLIPFATLPLFMTLLSILAITFLAIFIPLMGAIRPDYTLAYEADKASTTLTGILALIVVVATGVLASYFIRMTLSGVFSQDTSLNAFFAITLTTAFLIWYVSVSYTRGYKLDS